MVIKILKTGLLITATQFLLSSGCKKNSTNPCQSVVYSFAITSEWSPQREIYNVGDTILLSSSFPKVLTDLINSTLIIDYSNSTGIGGSYTFYELDTIQRQPKGAVSKFEFLPIAGTISDGGFVPNEQKKVTYIETSNNYSFGCKVIVKQMRLSQKDSLFLLKFSPKTL